MTQVLEITRRDKIRQTLGLINVTELDVCYDVTSEKIQLDCYSLSIFYTHLVHLYHPKCSRMLRNISRSYQAGIDGVSLSHAGSIQISVQSRYNIFTGMCVFFQFRRYLISIFFLSNSFQRRDLKVFCMKKGCFIFFLFIKIVLFFLDFFIHGCFLVKMKSNKGKIKGLAYIYLNFVSRHFCNKVFTWYGNYNETLTEQSPFLMFRLQFVD